MPVPYRQYYVLILPLLALWGAAWGGWWLSVPRVGEWRRGVAIWGGAGRVVGWAVAAGGTAVGLWFALRFSWGRGGLRLPGQDNLICLVAALAGGGLVVVAIPWRWVRTAGMLALLVAAWVWTPLRLLGWGPAALAAALVAFSPWVDRRRLAVLIVALAGAAWPWQQMHAMEGEHDETELAEIRYILANTTPQEAVFSGFHGVGAMRPHAYYYFFLHSEMRAMLTAQQLGPDVVEALRTVRPPIVVYDGDVKALPPMVQDFIRANYQPAGVGELWRRRDWTPAAH
jgi:hypothetical protein